MARTGPALPVARICHLDAVLDELVHFADVQTEAHFEAARLQLEALLRKDIDAL